MARAKQPVSISGIEFDALIDSDEGYSAQVPEYPTEEGFSVSDTIVLQSDTLNMTLFVTDTPVTWRGRHGSGPGRSEAVVKQLKSLYFSKRLVEVVTSEQVYVNMAIIGLNVKKSSDVGYAREIPISFKKVIVTSTQTTTIPDSYGKSGETGASGGTANTTSASGGGSGSGNGSGSGSGDGDGKSGSILYQAASGFGLI